MPRFTSNMVALAVWAALTILVGCSGERTRTPGAFISRAELGMPEDGGILGMFLAPDSSLGVVTHHWPDGRPRLTYVDWDASTGFGGIARRIVLPRLNTGGFQTVAADAAGRLVMRFFDGPDGDVVGGDKPRMRWLGLNPDGTRIAGFTERLDEWFADRPALETNCVFAALEGRFLLSDWKKSADPQPPQLLRLSPSGEVLDRRVYDEFRYVGRWNEPDTICFVADGAFYKWTNADGPSEPEPLAATVPPEGFQELTRLDDGSWIGIHSPRLARVTPEGAVDWIYRMPQHPDWKPSPRGGREIVLNAPYPTAFELSFRFWEMATDGEVLFGPGRPWNYTDPGGSGVWMIHLPKS